MAYTSAVQAKESALRLGIRLKLEQYFGEYPEDTLKRWEAYILATAKHETAGSFEPCCERGGETYFKRRYGPTQAPAMAKALGNLTDQDAIDYAGKGFVQLTGRGNYLRVGNLLGLGDKLMRFPHMANLGEIALEILVQGMVRGWFTGLGLLKLDRTLGPKAPAQYRRTVNGMDRAALIQSYATEYAAQRK